MVINRLHIDYDLMTVIIMRREKKTGEKGILDYLEGVFSSDIRKMKQYSDVKWSEKAEKERRQMLSHEKTGVRNLTPVK